MSPGPISNTKLLHPNNHRKIRSGLRISTDYRWGSNCIVSLKVLLPIVRRVVNEEIWDLMEQIYGGGPPICVPASKVNPSLQLQVQLGQIVESVYTTSTPLLLFLFQEPRIHSAPHQDPVQRPEQAPGEAGDPAEPGSGERGQQPQQ